MIINQKIAPQLMVDILTSEFSIEGKFVNILKDEIAADPTGRGYADARRASQLVPLINLPYTVSAGEPERVQPKVIPKENVEDLSKDIVDYFAKNPEEAKVYSFELEALLPTFTKGEVRPKDKRVLRALDRFVEIGAISQTRADEFLTIENPYFGRTITAPPRSEVLFGRGAFVTARDLRTAGIV